MAGNASFLLTRNILNTCTNIFLNSFMGLFISQFFNILNTLSYYKNSVLSLWEYSFLLIRALASVAVFLTF